MASRRRASARRATGAGSGSAPVVAGPDRVPAAGGLARRDRLLMAAACGFLAVAVWTVFAQTLGHGFVNYDDNEYVYENRHVVAGVTRHGIAWALTHAHSNNWHPVTWMSHMLDCQLYGLDPAGHHLTSVLLHAANAVLLLLVLRRMTGAFWPSVFVATIFAVHPLRAESVAWISERKDVLSGTFFLLVLAAWARYAAEPSLARYLLVSVLLALGLMSKPMLVTVPVILLLVDDWPLARWSRATRARLIREKLPLVALVLATVPAVLFAQQHALQTLETFPLRERLANAIVAYAAYLGDLVVPAGLVVFRPLRPVGLATTALALAPLLAITAAAVRLHRTRPYVLVGWLWYVVMLAPTVGIVQVGTQARADRFTYLPQIGLLVIVAWGAADAARAWRRAPAVLAASAAVATAAAIVVARQQVATWRDSQSLWTQALAHTGDNALAEANLGAALLEQGRLDEAMARFHRALAIDPGHRVAHVDLGNALVRTGRVEEAVSHYRAALAVDPRHANAAFNLGNALRAAGRTDEAIAAYRQAVAAAPDFSLARNNLGNALLARGRRDEAVAEYRAALAVDPDLALAHNNLGGVLAQTPDGAAEAVVHYRRALEIDPGYAEAHYNLGTVLFRSGRTADAVAEYRAALALRPDYADAHNNLGVALVREGRIEEAVVHYRAALAGDPGSAALDNLAQALALARANGQDALAARIEDDVARHRGAAGNDWRPPVPVH